MAASARADPDEEQPPREQPHRERRNRIAATFATADMVGNSRSPNGKYRRALPGFAFGDPRRHEYRRFAPGRPFDQASWGMECRPHQSPRIDCGSIAEASRRDARGPLPALCSQWLTTWLMGKDAPKANFVLILGDGGKRPLHGSGCLLDDLV